MMKKPLQRNCKHFEMRNRQTTEKLKAEDMMKWVGLMNNIGACVDEIVLNDIVYS